MALRVHVAMLSAKSGSNPSCTERMAVRSSCALLRHLLGKNMGRKNVCNLRNAGMIGFITLQQSAPYADDMAGQQRC
jgi:hypothetical protein